MATRLDAINAVRVSRVLSSIFYWMIVAAGVRLFLPSQHGRIMYAVMLY